MANWANEYLGHFAGDDQRFEKNYDPEEFVEDMLE